MTHVFIENIFLLQQPCFTQNERDCPGDFGCTCVRVCAACMPHASTKHQPLRSYDAPLNRGGRRDCSLSVAAPRCSPHSRDELQKDVTTTMTTTMTMTMTTLTEDGSNLRQSPGPTGVSEWVLTPEKTQISMPRRALLAHQSSACHCETTVQ